MNFATDLEGTALDGVLVYRSADYAFDFTPERTADLEARIGAEGTSSVALGTLQLELDVASGTVLYAWGYLPKTMWALERLPRPELAPAVVRAMSGLPLRPGVAINLPDAKRWAARYDPNSGWIYFGDETILTMAVQVASGIGLVITDAALRGVWLHPLLDG